MISSMTPDHMLFTSLALLAFAGFMLWRRVARRSN